MCKYCEGSALGCLHCARACMLELWQENAERCLTCKGIARGRIGDFPRFEYCPYCGRKLQDYLPDGVRSEKEAAREEKDKQSGIRRWTKQETDALICMRRNGYSIRECAAMIGRTEQQTMNKCGDLCKHDDTRAALGLPPERKKIRKDENKS